MVSRYVVTGDPMESPYGHWVEYSAYAEIAERCEKLRAALRECSAVLANLGCDEDNSPLAEAKCILDDAL